MPVERESRRVRVVLKVSLRRASALIPGFPHGSSRHDGRFRMNPRLGKVVLGLSAAGYPLTEIAIRRLGRRGAAITEMACCGLSVRDAAMVVAGVPTRLRRGPAILLWMELTAAIGASALGLQSAIDDESCKRARANPGPTEMARRFAVGTLFALHTVRFWIYLKPDQGRKGSNH